MPDIGEDAAYRLALAAELIDAGVAPQAGSRASWGSISPLVSANTIRTSRACRQEAAAKGTTVADPTSDTKKLMAPPRANFQEVYAAGERLAASSIVEQVDETKAALEQFGTYDFQRDKATNTWFADYVHAANYAVGVYMAGLGYEERTSVTIAQTYGFFMSSNKFSEEAKEWTEKGWEDAYRGYWLPQ